MTFKMRMNFVDVIADNSLENIYRNGKIVGFQFKTYLSDYRGEYLSCIDEFEVEVNGEKIDESLTSLNINNKSFIRSQFHNCVSEFWVVTEPATIKIMRPGGLESGNYHIKLNLTLRKPYLPTPGKDNERAYVPLDASGEKTLTIEK